MRRGGPILALAAVLLLGGCVYDPYTGTYVPCCNYYAYPYGYPYGYRYPPPNYPYGGPPGPYGAPPPGQPGQPPPEQPGYNGPAPGQAPPMRPGASVNPGQGGALAQRFAAANVTHDGRLTRAQAQAGMPVVAQNFDAIDVDRQGYVTLPEIRLFMRQRRAERSQSG